MTAVQKEIETLFEAGAHYGSTRARRHPTAQRFIFSTKDRADIFDLEETVRRLETARTFLSGLSGEGKQILLVGGKNEVLSMVKEIAEKIGMPYVAGRWIGGTLTNFKNIRKRIDRLEKLIQERASGELEKYTKKERLLTDREIDELLARFGGLVKMLDLPAAMVVVDTRHEETAVREANQLNIPVVGIANSDCDFSLIQYPIPANDGVVKSVRFFLEALASSYEGGKRAGIVAPEAKKPARAARE